MNLDYIPCQDNELIVWLKNYKTKIAIIGPQIDLIESDIAHEQKLCDCIIEKITDVKISRNNLNQTVNDKQNSIAELYKRISLHQKKAAFTPAVKEQLGVATKNTEYRK